MKKTLVLILLLILVSGKSYSQEASTDFRFSKQKELNLKYQKNLELKNKIIYDDNRISLKDSIYVSQEPKENPKRKSEFLGGLFSAIIPGAGEFYAKSYIKSAIFLAVEAGLWIAYGIFQKKGNDQTEFFQNYANQNWDIYKYAEWLKNQGFPKAGDINLGAPYETLLAQINACEEVNFSHTLPRFGEQQYYEVIGKYQNFIVGWSTADPNAINKNTYINYKLAQVDQYMSDRQKANDYFDNGTTMSMVVILNHIVSAADGVWSVIRYNKGLDVKTNVSFHSKYSFYQHRSVIVPHINLSVNF